MKQLNASKITSVLLKWKKKKKKEMELTVQHRKLNQLHGIHDKKIS